MVRKIGPEGDAMLHELQGFAICSPQFTMLLTAIVSLFAADTSHYFRSAGDSCLPSCALISFEEQSPAHRDHASCPRVMPPGQASLRSQATVPTERGIGRKSVGGPVEQGSLPLSSLGPGSIVPPGRQLSFFQASLPGLQGKSAETPQTTSIRFMEPVVSSLCLLPRRRPSE